MNHCLLHHVAKGEKMINKQLTCKKNSKYVHLIIIPAVVIEYKLRTILHYVHLQYNQDVSYMWYLLDCFPDLTEHQVVVVLDFVDAAVVLHLVDVVAVVVVILLHFAD